MPTNAIVLIYHFNYGIEFIGKAGTYANKKIRIHKFVTRTYCTIEIHR
jgi:hypothetical protein